MNMAQLPDISTSASNTVDTDPVQQLSEGSNSISSSVLPKLETTSKPTSGRKPATSFAAISHGLVTQSREARKARARLLPPSLLKIDGLDQVVEFRGHPAALAFELGGRLGNIVTSSKTTDVHKSWRVVGVNGTQVPAHAAAAAIARAQTSRKFTVTFRFGEKTEDENDESHLDERAAIAAAAAATAKQKKEDEDAAVAAAAAAAAEEQRLADKAAQEAVDLERARLADEEALRQQRMKEDMELKARQQAEAAAEKAAAEAAAEKAAAEAAAAAAERARQAEAAAEKAAAADIAAAAAAAKKARIDREALEAKKAKEAAKAAAAAAEAKRAKEEAEAKKLKEEAEAEEAAEVAMKVKEVEKALGLPSRNSVDDAHSVLLAALGGVPKKNKKAAPPVPVQKKPSGPCDKCDGPHDETVCPYFKGKARESHNDALDMYEKKKRAKSKGSAASGSGKNSNTDASGDDDSDDDDDDDDEPVTLTTNQATVAKQPGDGSCLFHSLSHGLRRCRAGPPTQHAGSLRVELEDWIEAHAETSMGGTKLADWVLWDSGTRVKAYTKRMRESNDWGGALEIAVCARLRKVEVHVYEQGRGSRDFTRISRFRPDADSSAANSSSMPKPHKGHERKVVSVLYGGRCHYDGLEVRRWKPHWRLKIPPGPYPNGTTLRAAV